jgi:hypothetical protein
MSSTATEDEKAVLAICRKFLDGIKTRDAAAMHSVVVPNGHGTLIRPPLQGSAVPQILQITLTECVERIPFNHPEDIEETIALATWEEGDDGDRYEGRRTEIRVDYDLAVAWTPYEVRIGGKISHVGTNIFNLMKRVEGEKMGEWVVTGVADTTRQPGTNGKKVADGVGAIVDSKAS